MVMVSKRYFQSYRDPNPLIIPLADQLKFRETRKFFHVEKGREKRDIICKSPLFPNLTLTITHWKRQEWGDTGWVEFHIQGKKEEWIKLKKMINQYCKLTGNHITGLKSFSENRF